MKNWPATMPGSKVVDAWALLAWLREEQPAAGYVRECLQQSYEGNTRFHRPLSISCDLGMVSLPAYSKTVNAERLSLR